MRRQAHLSHEVLDTTQTALDASAVQQGLPNVIAPVPLRTVVPEQGAEV